MTTVFVLGGLALVIAALAWVRPHPFNPQLKPREWPKGGENA